MPSADQITEYWGSVVGVPGSCDLEDPAVTNWQQGLAGIPEPTEETPELSHWSRALKISSWKAPGRDAISAFWWKKFPRTTNLLWGLFTEVFRGNSNLPEWFVRGRTLIIPKKGCSGDPDQYRPITCLNTGYKLFTAGITAELRAHCEVNNILPHEQKAMHRGQRGWMP